MKIFNPKRRDKITFSTLGFTKNEGQVVLFLIASFLFGLILWGYKQFYAPLPAIQKPVEIVSDSFTSENSNKYERDVEEFVLVNINQANQSELESLPGIGKVKAKRIIEYRKKNGKFHTIDDLSNVSGIGSKTVEKLNPLINL